MCDEGEREGFLPSSLSSSLWKDANEVLVLRRRRRDCLTSDTQTTKKGERGRVARPGMDLVVRDVEREIDEVLGESGLDEERLLLVPNTDAVEVGVSGKRERRTGESRRDVSAVACCFSTCLSTLLLHG